MAAKIFFGRVDGPLPIRWKAKRGLGRPRKVQQPVTIDSDSEHEQSEQENEANVVCTVCSYSKTSSRWSP